MITNTFNVTLASGASNSSTATTHGNTLLGVIVPSSWNNGNMNFQGSLNGTDFYDVYDHDGLQVAITPTAGVYTMLQDALLSAGFRYFRVVSDIPQSVLTTVTLVCTESFD